MAAEARQEEALGFSQAGRGSESAPGEKTGHDLPHILVGGNQTFRVQFADGNMNRPLVRSEFSQAVQSQVDTFSDADAGGPGEEEGITGRSSVRRNSRCRS